MAMAFHAVIPSNPLKHSTVFLFVALLTTFQLCLAATSNPRCKEICSFLLRTDFMHIYREHNKEADSLSVSAGRSFSDVMQISFGGVSFTRLIKHDSSVSSRHDLISQRGSHRYGEWKTDLFGCCMEPYLYTDGRDLKEFIYGTLHLPLVNLEASLQAYEASEEPLMESIYGCVQDRATLYLNALGGDASSDNDGRDLKEFIYGTLHLPLVNLEASLHLPMRLVENLSTWQLFQRG